MCPAALTFAVSAMTSIASFAAQQADYNAKAAQWKQNYTNALASARNEETQLTQRQMQENDALAQKNHLSLVEEAEKKADTEVSGAASGVAGLSLDSLVADVGRKADYNRLTYLKNWQYTAQQLQTEQDATVTNAESRINSVSVPTSPSPLGPILGIAGAGVQYMKDTM